MSKRLKRSLISSAFFAVILVLLGIAFQLTDVWWWYLTVLGGAVISFLMDYFVWNRNRYPDERR